MTPAQTPGDWITITIDSLQGLWEGFLGFLPELIGALIIFIIGWFISLGIGRLVTEILRRLQFNELFKSGNWSRALDKADIKVDASKFIGEIFKWVLVIVFLLAAVEILGLAQFANFVRDILGYLPNVIVAALIFVVTVIVVDYVEKLIRAGMEGIKVSNANFAGAIVRWAIWIFAIMAILSQLKVATSLINTLFQGIVAVLVISFGLAFGLGGRTVARDLLEDFRERLRR